MNELRELLDHTIEEMGISQPKYVLSSDSIEKAVNLMQENKIGSTLVIDEHAKLQGILTERDILNKVVGKDLDLATSTVQEYMTASPKTVASNESIILALSMMSREGFRHLPIINMEGSPIGVISIRDIMGYFTNHLND